MIVGTADQRGVYISPTSLERHTYVLGLNGTGKTTLLLNLASGIVNEGLGGLLFLDPHGDAAYDLLGMIPERRVKDTILFDPVEQEDNPIGLNLYALPDPNRIDILADWSVMALKKAVSVDAPWVMTADRVARHLFYALAPQGGTLLDVSRFLTDKAFRFKYYAQLQSNHPQTFNFWYHEYDSMGYAREDRMSERQAEVAGPILRRLDRYTSDKRLGDILGQSKLGIDVSAVMEQSKILVLRLPESELGEHSAQLLGSVMLSHLFVATLSRSKLPREKRKPFYIVIDEFDKFIHHEDLPRFFNEARKFNVRLIVAHQHRSQLDTQKIKDAVLGVGTIFSFQTLEKDASEVGKQIGGSAKDELPYLELHEAYTRIDRQGVYKMKSILSGKGNEDVREKVIANSKTIGTPVDQVRAEIASRNRRKFQLKEESYELRESPI